MLPRYRTLSTLPRCRNFSTLPWRGNHYGAWYPTTDQHNRPCFHSVGTSPRYHSIGIYYGARYPNNRSTQSSMLPWCRNFPMLPRRRNLISPLKGNISTLPRCRNFSILLRHKNHYATRYLTTNQHNRPCFHGIGTFLHFHGVGTSPLYHGVGIIMVLDTQQQISTIVHAPTI